MECISVDVKEVGSSVEPVGFTESLFQEVLDLIRWHVTTVFPSDRLLNTIKAIHRSMPLPASPLLLDAAVRRSNVPLIQWLITDLGIPVDTVLDGGHTALCKAIMDGNVGLVLSLIELGASYDTPTGDVGDTPLMLACRLSSQGIVALLLEKGVLPNHGNTDGDTPLHVAAFVDSVEITGALLEAGADPNLRNRQWVTPLMYACAYGHSQVASCLLRGGARYGCLSVDNCSAAHFAVRSGSLRCLKLLVQAGAKLDSVDDFGWSILDEAATLGHYEIVVWMLERNSMSDEAIKLAAERAGSVGVFEMRRYLLAAAER